METTMILVEVMISTFVGLGFGFWQHNVFAGIFAFAVCIYIAVSFDLPRNQ